jgi:hypothetical protein
MVSNENAGIDQWAFRMQQVIDAVGGVPLPLDVSPSNTADKYVNVYQPSTDTHFQMYYCYSGDYGSITVQVGGTPTSGSFKVVLNYADNIQPIAQDFTTPLIGPSDSNATLEAKLNGATNAGGNRLDRFTPQAIQVVSGGPLPAPVTCRVWIATPLRAIPVSITTDTVVGGTPSVSAHTPGPITQCYGGSIITPGGGFDGISAFDGTYRDQVDGSGFYWQDRRWGGAATSIEFMGGMPSIDEVVYAQANDIGLEHALTILTGDAQGFGASYPFVWPATRTDGGLVDDLAISEGARIRLPADTDESYCEANFPEFLWVIRTLKTKGAILYDRTHGGCELTLRQAAFTLPDGTTEYGPEGGWSDVMPTLATGGGPRTLMQAVPWHLAQIMHPDFSLPPGGITPPPPTEPALTGDLWGAIA